MTSSRNSLRAGWLCFAAVSAQAMGAPLALAALLAAASVGLGTAVVLKH